MGEPRCYRKRPVEVEAMGPLSWENVDELAAWCGGEPGGEVVTGPPRIYAWVDIRTLEGRMRAWDGDFIIRGVKGEFYPCKPDIFEQTYEAVDAD